jgi:hypothetical protein
MVLLSTYIPYMDVCVTISGKLHFIGDMMQQWCENNGMSHHRCLVALLPSVPYWFLEKVLSLSCDSYSPFFCDSFCY